MHLPENGLQPQLELPSKDERGSEMLKSGHERR